MIKSKIFFIAGVGTDIGKTYLLENLIKKLRSEKIAVSAIKPIVSGFKHDDLNSDSARILKALDLEIFARNFGLISPWRFDLPASPHVAARVEDKKISFNEVKDFCLAKISEAKENKEYLFIEAAGGVMTPINDKKTFLDLAYELRIPVLLLTANYLGSISHTLSAVESLRQNRIEVSNIIVNDYASNTDSTISDMQFVEDIENFAQIKSALLQDFLKTFLD